MKPDRSTIAVNSRWQHKKSAAQVTVTRVTIGTVSYIALDKSVSGSVPQWQFLEDFDCPNRRRNRPDQHDEAACALMEL